MPANESYWPGEERCKHHKGVQDVVIKTCCGGKRKERVTIGCGVHKRLFAVDCRNGICRYYERRSEEDGRREG